jgi:hypothetical protein
MSPLLADSNADGAQDVIEFNWSQGMSSVDAYSGRDGALLWSSVVGPGGGAIGHWPRGPNPCILQLRNGTLAIAGRNVSALDASTGRTLWEVPGIVLGADPVCSDVDGDGNEDFVAPVNGPGDLIPKNISAFSGVSGRHLWNVPVGRMERYSGASAGDVDGDGVADVVFSDAAGTRAVRGSDGSLLWSASQPGPYAGGLPVLVPGVLPGRRLVVVGVWKEVVALDGKDGRLVWNRTVADSEFGQVAAARLSPGEPTEVFASSSVLDASNGSLRWQLPAPGPAFSFVEADADGVVDVVLWPGESITLVSGSTRKTLWSWALGTPGRGLALGDLDGDGSAELVYASDLGVLGVLDWIPSPPPKLSVSMTTSPGSGTAPLGVDWRANASGGQPPYHYAVDLGDGTSSDTASGTHVFHRSGRFTLSASVTDAAGQTASGSAFVIVDPPATGSPPPLGLTGGQAAVAVLATAGLAGVGGAWVVLKVRRSRDFRKPAP